MMRTGQTGATEGQGNGKATLASHLVARLREAIISGELAAGSKINLDRARQQFEVSLSPLREALARLIADGFVQFEDNRGYWVAPVSLENLEEVTALRLQLEPLALRQACERAPASWEGEVMRALHRLNRIARDLERPESLAAWEEAHRAFHLTLIGGYGRPLLLQLCATLLNLNDRYRRLFPSRTGGDRDVAWEHGEIAQAAVARDTDYACEKLAEHLARTGANLRRHLQAQAGDDRVKIGPAGAA